MDHKKIRYFKLATDSYRKSDEKLWVTAYACGQVVGNYDRGATMGLASDMGVSTDTIEDLAHAYSIYNELCELDEGKFRQFVRNARKSPYIYYSHFRALYDARSQYKLSNNQILDLLMDVVQGEGNISSRGIDGHTRSRYGDTRGWSFYARRAEKELGMTLQQPDLPNLAETVGNAYICTFEVKDKKQAIIVVANNPQRAENIARKKLAEKIGESVVKKLQCTVKHLGEVVTDSKNVLSVAFSWIGENG